MSSCSTQILLKGSYPTTAHFVKTDLSFDEVWTKVIDYFAVNGVPITTIDKSSGLIISSKMSFLETYTTEDEYGIPINSNAFTVAPYCKVLTPTTIIGDWNVRVKTENGKTVVNVNLISLNARGIYRKNGSITPVIGGMIPIKSTGVFESQLLNLFK